MWLKQFQGFQISFSFLQDLLPRLNQHPLMPCAPHARTSHGWKPVSEHAFGLNVQDYGLCILAKEEKVLPSSVIQIAVEQKNLEHQTMHGRPLQRHEKQQLKQELEFNLLPKAFCKQKKITLLFDDQRQHMYVECQHAQQLDIVLAHIHKTLAQNYTATPLQPPTALLNLWQTWLTQPKQLPQYLNFADRIRWIDQDEPQKQRYYQGIDWDTVTAQQYFEQGYIPKEIAFTWRDQIQFTLNAPLVFKRAQALPSFNEALRAGEDQLSNLLLLGHTFRQLFDDFCPKSSQ